MSAPEAKTHADNGGDDGANPDRQPNPTARSGFWRNPNHWVAIATVVIAVANGLYTFFALQQWNTMKSTLDEMKRSGQTATDQTWRAVGNTNWLARETMNAVAQARISAEKSERNARAALDATIAISRNEQRAWIIDRAPQGTPTDVHVGGALVTPVKFVNAGKTPAHNVRGCVRVEIVESGRDPTFRYDSGTSWMFNVGEMVPALDIPSFNADARENHDPVILTRDQVSRIISGSSYVTTYGEFTYSDLAGKHWMRFCKQIYLGPADKGISPEKCAPYNSSGDGLPPPFK